MSEIINGIIYKATNMLNNKVYIGMTTQSLKDRMYGHYRSSVNSDKNYHFLNALKKNGWENFTWDIVEEGLYEPKEALYQSLKS
ncbi:GIY-YIG nuclease family protein [Viridibacillus arvi]|uniref:GIY-YIG nuclease family protein n=1 Tax=Viridibacillus arvi TaxID=263475 RepID=UPI00187B3B3F|nr:GIY-YIG nuclease family protein [Viridibacillus sp. JNUCC-6]QOV13198.1 GIY-YIG nuclease family protein [Viridibacillus sp. JNUCC-6]